MTTLVRRLIILALGFLGGIAAWPLAEVILSFQADFPSYLAFLAPLGAAVGLIMGAFFGAAEGITSRIDGITRGMLVGAVIGCVGGAVEPCPGRPPCGSSGGCSCSPTGPAVGRAPRVAGDRLGGARRVRRRR